MSKFIRYKAEATQIKNGEGRWDYQKIEIFGGFHVEGLIPCVWEKIGEYVFNYSNRGAELFCPFKKNEKWYALYSKCYTATRIMELPSCIDIGGEIEAANGFCPVEYLVPTVNQVGKLAGTLAFVAGCHWGDDHSMKIQVIDISKIEEGIIKREARFGYHELPRNQSLQDSLDFTWTDEEDDPIITINTFKEYNLLSNYNVAIDTVVDKCKEV